MARLAVLLAAGIAIIATDLTDAAQAAGPINLNCSGKWWNLEHNVYGQPVDGASIIVDLDQMVVSGSLGEWRISDISDSRVIFEGPFEENGKNTGTETGSIDRINGRTSLQVSRDGGKSFIIVYQMTCQSTKPLF